MRILFQILLAAPLCAAAAAQTNPATTPKPATHPDPKPEGVDAPQIPAVTLDFEKQAAIPGAPMSQAWAVPIACSSEGVPVVVYPSTVNLSPEHTLSAADFMPAIYSLDPKGGHGFSASAAPGLYDVSFHGYFASASDVFIEVRARDDDTQVTRSLHTPQGDKTQNFYTGKQHEYLLKFDLDGSFKKAFRAPDAYNFIRIAPLPDDTFIALAYDTGNRAPQLMLLDSDLQFLRPIDIPEAMANDPKVAQGETGGIFNVIRATTRLSGWQFTSARGSVLLYQRDASAPVVEVSPGGRIREVPIQAPDGYDLHLVLTANDLWLMQFRRKGLPDTGSIDIRPQTGNMVWYEVDPLDGSLRRRVDLPPDDKDHPGVQFACESDGKIIAFLPKDNRMVQYTADLAR